MKQPLITFSLMVWLLTLSFVSSLQASSFVLTGSMTSFRELHTATLLQNGKILAAGGLVEGSSTATAEIYDPTTGSWTATQPMHTERVLHTATLLSNGKVLVVGGSDSLGDATASAELYDPASGTWTTINPMNVTRQGHTAALLGSGKVLIAGGLIDTGYTANSELYDPSSGMWTATGSMTTNFFSAVTTTLANGRVLVAGGVVINIALFTDETSPNTSLYDPSTGNWVAEGQLNIRRQGHTATLLPNGKVLAAGGTDSPQDQNYLASAELYDPNTGNWTATGTLKANRLFHTATLLTSGKVLVTGGQTNGPDAELYDPSSGTWTATATMNGPGRAWHTATLLPNGTVLIAGGGYDASEIYLPTSGSVKVTISPADAISAGAQWRVDGGTFLDSGTVVSNLLGGSHTISFKSISGWSTPSDQVISISDGVTNFISGIYVAGAVQVTLSPAAAVSAGAQWQVDGGAFFDSGAVVTNLLAGSHTISFKNISGWIAPSAQSTSVADGVTNVVSGTYVEGPGSLQVNLGPAGAVSAGAQWQVDGGVFLASGAVVNNLSAGSHTISFKNISGWIVPSAQSASVSGGITNVFSGTYLANVGALQVNLSPAGAVSAGAQWQVDGGAFLASGAVVTNLLAGSHTVSFKNISGWIAPSAQSISVSFGVTNIASGTYLTDPGAIQVNLSPSAAVSAGAQWQMDGGTFRDSGVILGNVSPGSHTLSFKTIPGWVTPASQNVSINSDVTNISSGVYGLLPATTTLPPGNFNGSTVTLNASVSPNGSPTTVYYNYGPDSMCTNLVSTSVLLSNNLNANQAVPIIVTGLLPGPAYRVQVVASNSVGIIFGSVLTFSWPGVIDTNQNNGQTVTWNRAALGQAISGFCCASGPQAVNYTWPNNNNWSQAFQFATDPCGDQVVSQPSNWGTNNPPNGTSYNVIVGSQGGAPVNLDIAVTVNSFVLQAGGGLNISQQQLAANLFDFQGDFNITTPGSGRLLVLSGGKLMKSSGTNSLAFDPSINLSANNATLEADAGTLILPGASSVYSNCVFNAASGAILQFMPTNQSVQATLAGVSSGAGGGLVLFNSGQLNADPGGSTLNFPGPLFVWTGGSISVGSVTVTNLGVINIQGTNGPQVIQAGTFLNQGTMENLDTNALLVNGIFTVFVNDANGIYDLAADGGISGTGTFYNYGLLRKSGGTNTSTIGLLLDNRGGTIDVESGNLVLAGSDRTSSNGTVHVNSNATLDLTGGRNVTWTGTLTGTGAGQVLLSSGRFESSGEVSFNLAGSLFLWTGGIVDLGGGSMTNLGVINLKGSNAPQVLGAGGFYNAGLMANLDTNGLTIASFGGSIENLPGGTYDFATDGGIAGFGHFYNDGLVRKEGGTNTSVISPTFVNQDGSIEVDMGTLSLSGPFDQGGGTMTFRLNGFAPGQSGQLLDSSSVTLGGALKVSFADTFAPPIGSQFQLVSGSSCSGIFSAINVPAGTMVTYSSTGVFLVVTSAVPVHILSPQIVGTNFLFQIQTINGQSYTVQKSDDLNPPNWTFYNNFTGNGGLYQFVTPATNVARRFFRVREP